MLEQRADAQARKACIRESVTVASNPDRSFACFEQNQGVAMRRSIWAPNFWISEKKENTKGMREAIDFAKYRFPQPELLQRSDSDLLDRMAAWLLDATDEVAGTDASASPRLDYARDSVRQIRDVLVARGHRFSADDEAAMAAIGS